MVIKLRESLGTNYIINSLAGGFRGIVLRAKEDSTVIDLAGCRFGPDCANIIKEHEKNVVFINTEEPELNALLESNRTILNTELPEYPLFELPELNGNFNIIEYMNNIPAGQYTVDVWSKVNNYNANVALTCLVLLCRPDVELDLIKCTTDIFDRLCKNLNIESFVENGYTEFLKAYSPIICTIHVNDKEFVSTDRIIPAEIGTVRVFDISTSSVLSENYMELISSLLQELTVYVNKANNEFYYRLVDLLQYKEDAVDEY